INNLIPVTLGNIVGGAVFVGMYYWFVYLRKTA
ncbi:MAG: formate transporter FocA, partial [Syntrophomonadaceae bacterium]|nr:formate transporter FocA [Syntrophomonadaceae bacterium]NLN87634.1 formate transporter FocA [Syntrophomonadaceae bacterium]